LKDREMTVIIKSLFFIEGALFNYRLFSRIGTGTALLVPPKTYAPAGVNGPLLQTNIVLATMIRREVDKQKTSGENTRRLLREQRPK